MVQDRKEIFSDLVETGLTPANLRVEPESNPFVMLNNVYRRSLSLIQGVYKSVSYVVGVFPWAALRVSSYGSGMVDYLTIDGTAPAAYADTDELNGNPAFHRLDINVLTDPLLIRIKNWQTLEWGDDIYVPAGFMSLEVSGRSVQIKQVGAGTNDYYLTGYW